MTTIHKNMRADSSLNSLAETISQGKKKSRLQLGKTSSTAVFIAGNKIDNPFKRLVAEGLILSGRFAKFKTDDKTFLINVKSASKRLHCSKEQIKDTSKSDYFSWLVNQAETTELTLKSYKKIYNKHFSEQKVSPGEPLLYKKEKTTLSAHELMNLVKSVVTSKTNTLYNLTKDKKIVITHLKEGKISLKFIEKIIENGKTFQILGLSSKCCIKYVCKIPKEQGSASDIEENRQVLENELNIVQKLNRNGPQAGILLNIHPIKGYHSKEFGLMIPYYKKGDYLSVCQKPLKSFEPIKLIKLLNKFEQLFHGVAYMHENNIIHSDIKVENILIHEDRIDIADFGGSIDLNKKSKLEEMYTPIYRHLKDHKLLQELRSAGEDDIPLLKAMDVFAMGSVLHVRISQEFPYSITEWDGRNWQDGADPEALPDHIPEELDDLLLPLIDSTWQNRPSADEAYQLVKDFRKRLEEECDI